MCCFISLQHFNLFQKIYFFNKREIKIRFTSTIFFDGNNTRMGPILHNGFNDWITDTFRCSVNLIKLWNVKTGYNIRKGSFKTLAVSLSLLVILLPSTIVIFSFEIILFDNNGLTTLQNFLLPQTYFSFKLLKYPLLLFRKSGTHRFVGLVYLSLFSSVLFLRKNVPQHCS